MPTVPPDSLPLLPLEAPFTFAADVAEPPVPPLPPVVPTPENPPAALMPNAEVVPP